MFAKVELTASSPCSAVLHFSARANSFRTVVVLTELLWRELKCSVIPLFIARNRYTKEVNKGIDIFQ